LVVLTHRAGDVVVHLRGVWSAHSLPHPALEFGHWPVIVCPSVRPALGPPSALDLRQVPDGVPDCDLVRCLARPPECRTVAERDQDESLAELRHTVTPGINDALF